MIDATTAIIIICVVILIAIAIVAYYIVRLILSNATRPIDEKIIRTHKEYKSKRGRKPSKKAE